MSRTRWRLGWARTLPRRARAELLRLQGIDDGFRDLGMRECGSHREGDGGSLEADPSSVHGSSWMFLVGWAAGGPRWLTSPPPRLFRHGGQNAPIRARCKSRGAGPSRPGFARAL